jgi:hypothetical protein
MNEHVTDLLGAYLDGELETRVHERVRGHLTGCSICRRELAGLRKLSGLLSSATSPAVSSEVFSARLTPHLTPRPVVREVSRTRQIVWLLIPVAVLIAFLFVKLIFGMGAALVIANQTGILGGSGGFLENFSFFTTLPQPWFFLINKVLEAYLGIPFTKLDSILRVADGLLLGITWQLALALTYIAWLVAAWNRRNTLLKISEIQT